LSSSTNADIGASSSDGGVDIEKLGESNQKRLLVSREGNLESNYATSSLRPERTSWSPEDCIGTSMRHRCKSIVNFEMLPKPPALFQVRKQSLAGVAQRNGDVGT